MTGEDATAAAGEDRWDERDTSPERVDAALRGMLRSRHVANRAIAPARVLNLVVIADVESKSEVSGRLAHIGRYHPSRTILCAVEPDRATIDASAKLRSDERPEEEIGVVREQVELDIGPEHLAHLDTIIAPVLASELPTVLWSPDGHEEAIQSLLGMVDVILLDADDLSGRFGVASGAERVIALSAEAYIVDLAWIRTTPWRERLAAGFDDPSRREELDRLDRVSIHHNAASPASALLLAGWMCSRLGWTPGHANRISGTLRAMATRERDGGSDEVAIELEPAELEVPGIAGVTVSCGEDFSLALHRGKGGLVARERRRDHSDHEWQVLGASRGEGGILGEGVRQALLRDPTYGPALAAARRLAA